MIRPYKPRSDIAVPASLMRWYRGLVKKGIPYDARQVALRREMKFTNRQQRLPDPIGAVRGRRDREIIPEGTI